MLNIMFGAGAASRYGSGSTKMMQLLAAPAPHHCLQEWITTDSKYRYNEKYWPCHCKLFFSHRQWEFCMHLGSWWISDSLLRNPAILACLKGQSHEIFYITFNESEWEFCMHLGSWWISDSLLRNPTISAFSRLHSLNLNENFVCISYLDESLIRFFAILQY
jgi:hypothetical protein